MVTRRVTKSVLTNFLNAYVSRNSDYEGYWLFGFLVGDLRELQINLLAPTGGERNRPLGVAVASAAAKFEDQVGKAALTRSRFREAWLTIRRLPGLVPFS